MLAPVTRPHSIQCFHQSQFHFSLSLFIYIYICVCVCVCVCVHTRSTTASSEQGLISLDFFTLSFTERSLKTYIDREFACSVCVCVCVCVFADPSDVKAAARCKKDILTRIARLSREATGGSTHHKRVQRWA